LELATQATAQADTDLAFERRKNADLQTQVDTEDSDEQAMVKQASINARVKDLEAQLAAAESDRDTAILRATAAERTVENTQEKIARGHSGESLENVTLLEAEDRESYAALKARVRLLESELARAQGSSAALQDAAARAAERLQAQALKERELEQQLADASTGGPQLVGRAFEGMGAVNSILAGQMARCLRGRPEDPDSPNSSPPFPRV